MGVPFNEGLVLTPTLNHYHCVNVVTDCRSSEITDTFKFLNHTLPVPSVILTNQIVKATKQLKQAIKGHTTQAPDELKAIAHLHAPITGAQPDPSLPELLTPPTVAEPLEAHELLIEEPPILHLAQTIKMETSPTTRQGPNTIPFKEDELDNATVIVAEEIPPPPRYNLCSKAFHIIQSAINDDPVNPKDFIAFTIIDEATGKALEYCDLIKLDKYKDVWSRSYTNELG